ncbi:MAG: phosphoglucosamine mutase [Planctomycetota bacterium]
MENLFGTDGVRDVAGTGWLAADGLAKLGAAISGHLRAHGVSRPRVLFGRDTRVSGADLESQLAGALHASGCEVASAGVVPTPAVSALVAAAGFDLGVVISASHNPPEFNGVKLFDDRGRKLPVADELAVSERARAAVSPPVRLRIEEDPTWRERYLDLLAEQVGASFLGGMRVVLDCACGATATVARRAFENAGAVVTVLNEELDGRRINAGSGSTHPSGIGAATVQQGAALGVAFDGDGDRAILVDESGGVVDGDEMLCLWGMDLNRDGRLAPAVIVATVMSNAGMERFLREGGIELVRTGVGDREVFQEMERRAAVLGGEQSGHIIYRPEANTGDGLRTGLHLARVLRRSGQSLSRLRAQIPRYPQVLLNREVAEKRPFAELPSVCSALDSAVAQLQGRGRVLLRYSGTEPLVRILVEGPDDLENRSLADAIAAGF